MRRSPTAWRRAVTPFRAGHVHPHLARVLENAEMGSDEQRARHGIETRQVPMHPARPPGIAEVEELVVATRTLSVADWRRAFTLGYLLTAAHSLRLLDVVLQVAWRAAGVPVRRLAESLLARMSAALPSASALGRIHAVLQRHADAVLAGRRRRCRSRDRRSPLGGRGRGGRTALAAAWRVLRRGRCSSRGLPTGHARGWRMRCAISAW